MKSNWVVIVTKVPVVNDFRANFFPRYLHYKKEAIELAKEVLRKGGEAEVLKREQFEEDLVIKNQDWSYKGKRVSLIAYPEGEK